MTENALPVFGLVGKIAAGKNFVADILEKKGFLCIDCDKLIHQVIVENSDKILEAFAENAKSAGIELRGGDGSLNRRALGTLLFLDKTLLARQEAIVYPPLVLRVEEIIQNASESAEAVGASGVEGVGRSADGLRQSPRGVVINAAVLYKTPELLKKCRSIFFVDAPARIRFARVAKRDNLSAFEIAKRFWAQRDLLFRYKNAARENGIEIARIKNYGDKTEREVERALAFARL